MAALFQGAALSVVLPVCRLLGRGSVDFDFG